MAVSPLLPRSPSAINAGASPGQVKSLSVRNTIPQKEKAHPIPQSSSETDIAERLNEQTAAKYVKGRCSLRVFNCGLYTDFSKGRSLERVPSL